MDRDVTLDDAGNLACGVTTGGEAQTVKVINNHLGNGCFAGAIFDVAEGVVLFTEGTDVEAFAGNDDAAAAAADSREDVLGEGLKGVMRFGQIELEGELAFWVAKASGGRDKAGFTPHGLVDGDRLGSADTGVFFVGVLDEEGPEACGTAVARSVVNQATRVISEIVINSFGDTDDSEFETALAGEVGNFIGGIHGVVTADVKKVTDVMSGDDVEDTVEVLTVGVAEFVAARADGTGARGMTQERQLVRIFLRKVEEVFREDAFNTVACSEEMSDVIREGATAVNDAEQRGVNDRRRATRLSNEGVKFHGCSSEWVE